MRKVRENILTFKGDQSFFAGNKPVWVTDADGNTTLNGLLDGQGVIFDKQTGVSLAWNGGATAASNPRIVIAVGMDTNGDGYADKLRRPFGEMIYGNSVQAATAEPPTCGLVPIKDLLFKCTHCNEDYSIKVTIEDDITQNQFPYNRPEEYPFSVNSGCCECDSCDDNIDPTALVCALVDRINEKNWSTSVKKRSVFTKQQRRAPQKPFTAVRLYGSSDPNIYNSLDFCINPVTGDCDTCTEMDAIKGLRFTHPVDGLTTVTFSPATYANGTSPQAVLPRIIAATNAALDGHGSAVAITPLSGSGRPCCAYRIQVNSCDPSFQFLDENDAPIPTCAATNPFTDVTVTADCKDCDGDQIGATGWTPTAGIRFIANDVDIECVADFPSGTPRGILFRDIEVYPGEDFACGSFFVRNVQNKQIPRNLGYEWKWREYTSDNGGQGRAHNAWGFDPKGAFGLPLGPKNGSGGSRAYATEADCKELYCVYALEHSIPGTDIGIHGRQVAPRGATIFLIPHDDTTTANEFETFWNTYAGSLPLSPLDCAVDQDQVEQTLDQSGDVDQAEFPNAGLGYIQ